MATFEEAIPKVMANEGGLSNNPADPGGETKYGISHASYPNVDIANLTLAGAEAIIKASYWRFDNVDSQEVATKLLDMAVNLGLGRAVYLLQLGLKELGATLMPDGEWGTETLASLNGSSEQDVIRELCTEQQSYYVELVAKRPELYQFLKGWLHRANEV